MILTTSQQLKPPKVKDKVELLRQILMAEQDRELTYEEAADIGTSLILFFEVLAANSGETDVQSR